MDNYSRVNQNECYKTYMLYNFNGTIKNIKDEYEIVTAYDYDNYGNLLSVKIYNDSISEETREIIVTTFTYDEEESLREYPKSVIENNIETKYNYNDLGLIVESIINNKQKTEYEYDPHIDKIIKISNVDIDNEDETLFNELLYDRYGRLKCLIDSTGTSYGFLYNATDTKNNQTVLFPYVTKTFVDKYGKVVYQENGVENSESLDKIEYEYQDAVLSNEETFTESRSAAEIKKIIDPYEETEYTFNYD